MSDAVETRTPKCPAGKCALPAALCVGTPKGDLIVCEAKHGWPATNVELMCKRCKMVARHIQLKPDRVVCAFCSFLWALDQVQFTDSIEAGIASSTPRLDAVMVAIDDAAKGAAALIGGGEISESEAVGRFTRTLTHLLRSATDGAN